MTTELAPLPEIERLSPACIRILGGNPGKFSLQGTNTYLVGKGTERLLVDTGEGQPSWIAAIKQTLQKEQAIIATALITHWHHDHQGGIPHLLEAFPRVPVYKHQPELGQLDMVDGQTFMVQGASLTARHMPGHAADHMVFVLEEEDAMFAGDNVLGQGTSVYEDLGTYMSSLGQMKELFSGRIYPGHGPIVADGPAKIDEYIHHRSEREKQVVQTLRSTRMGTSTGDADTWTPMELVKVIYADIPESLHAAAERGVGQILCKLRNDGRVIVEGIRWRVTE